MTLGGGNSRTGGGVLAFGVGGITIGSAAFEVVTLIITVLLTYQPMTKIDVRRNHGVVANQLQAHVMPFER